METVCFLVGLVFLYCQEEFMVSEGGHMQMFMQSIFYEHVNWNVISTSGHKQLQTDPYCIIMYKVTFILYAKASDVNLHV
jgi:hypothetical protein